ncbi:methyltransferase domain-containing protein [Oceaniovalibus sp. ACAM 378]|uniref:methyltransferase domain-containing protein n=1 Tax=Oceaniovalibus sp. ACAM 378 TaxID=2599923 RepID=UPI00165210CA|nr:methyltransferase domain-containing protein [Oceaniovalibus sp. ACAM 378]
MSDPTAANHPKPNETRERIAQTLARAEDAFRNQDRDLCLTLCHEVLTEDDTPLDHAITVSLLLREIGQEELASHVQHSIVAAVRSSIDAAWDSPGNLVLMAQVLDSTDDRPEAERLYRRAYDIDPTITLSVIALAVFLIETDRAPEALDLVGPAIESNDKPLAMARYFAVTFGHRGATEQAITLMERTRTKCKSASERGQIDHVLAGLRGKDTGLDQHAMAVTLFDKFAENYDEQLEKLGNKGPTVMLSLLEQLNLPRTPTRRILDAGCGTGLCAPFLRKWARDLQGVDLSVGMLQKCRAKGQYDSLARTDISALHTFPEGPFDMIVCGDVLVYFGALEGVFGNFRKILRPGGWLLFTVEEATDPKRGGGYQIYGSGRYRHGETYLQQVLDGAGFTRPKTLLRDRLRDELGSPVMGLAMAAQKPALLGA